jgi:phospholipid/cholesterol/gamma-HCH transport system ATP-binding protein
VQEVLGFVGLEEYIDRMPSELSGGQRRASRSPRRWPPSRDSALRRSDNRPRPDHAMTVDEEMIKLRDFEGVTSIIVTHQLRDAFFVATHEAVRQNSRREVHAGRPQKADEAEFIMLKRRRGVFRGNATRTADLIGSIYPAVLS